MAKKSFYYNFLPAKSELESWISGFSYPNQITRVVVEIRDIYPTPAIDYHNPWQIKKKLTPYEVMGSKIMIPFHDTFEHIFRYWGFGATNHVVLGNKLSVHLWDVTEQNNPKKYQGENIFFEMLPNDDYILGSVELFKDRNLEVDDEIGLFYDPRISYFQFKLFRRIIL